MKNEEVDSISTFSFFILHRVRLHRLRVAASAEQGWRIFHF